MFALVLGLTLSVILAIVVMAPVVVPARRDGREVLTERGEEVVAGLKARSEDARARLERSHAA